MPRATLCDRRARRLRHHHEAGIALTSLRHAGDMTKTATRFMCIECGAGHAKWAGQCTACAAWNTLVEESVDGRALRLRRWHARPARPSRRRRRRRSGSPADRHRRARPGARRRPRRRARSRCSAASRASARARCCCSCSAAVAGHRRCTSPPRRAPQQVRLRAERLGAAAPRRCGWPAETSLPRVVDAHRRASRPTLVVVDSIQTIADPSSPSAPGSVAQVRECAQRLVVEAKRRGVADRARRPRHQGRRAGRAARARARRRHGARRSRASATTPCACCGRSSTASARPTSSGLFEMTDAGLVGVPDPSQLFLADRRPGVAGLGRRPGDGGPPPAARRGPGAHRAGRRRARRPRRNAQGLDGGRLALLLAVLERRAGLRVGRPATSTPRPSAACGSSSRAPTSACALAVGQRRRRPPDRPTTSSCAARSASAASCARSPTPSGASPRRRGSASGGPSSRRRRRPCDGHRRCVRVAHRSPRRCAAVGDRLADGGRRSCRRGRPHRRIRAHGQPVPRRQRRAARRARQGRARARRCATASTASCGPRRARCSSSTTGPTCWPSARAASCSTPPFSPQRLSELAKMDGAIILVDRRQPHRPGQRPPRARPDGADQRDRHPPPHGRAGRPLARRCR